jgi:hypothetical protein
VARQRVRNRPLICFPEAHCRRADIYAIQTELALYRAFEKEQCLTGIIPAAIRAWVDSMGPELDPVYDPMRVFQGISLYQFLLKKRIPQIPQPFVVRPLLMRSVELFLAYNMRIRAAEDCLRMAWINMAYGYQPSTKKVWRSTPGMISRGARYLRTDPSRDAHVENLMSFWREVKEYYRRLI